MSLNRRKSWLFALGIQFLWVAVAVGQQPPLAPAPGTRGAESGVYDAEIFSQPEMTLFGPQRQQSDGYFGTVEALIWTVSNPKRTDIGANGQTREVYINNSSTGNQTTNPAPGTFTTQDNSTDNSFIRATPTGGFRFDWGVVNDDRGWLFSAFSLTDNQQSFTGNNVSMVYNDPGATVYNAYNGTVNGQVVGSGGTTTAVNALLPATTIRLPLLNGYVMDPRSFNFTSTNGNTTLITPSNGNFPFGFPIDINRNGVLGPYAQVTGVPVPTPVNNNGTFVPYPVDYGDTVPMPVLFTSVKYFNTTKTWGIEANRLFRAEDMDRFGGSWEFFGGVRYFTFTDQFAINANGGILDSSYWDTTASNNIVGPQLGMRWLKRMGRLTYSMEGRATAGANFQNIRQQGVVGSNLNQQPTLLPPSFFLSTNPLTNISTVTAYPIPNNPGGGPPSGAFRLNQPLNLAPTGFNSAAHFVTFSPLVELRAKVNYQLFRSVSLSAGWTGIWVDGVARATNVMDWTLPNFGILSDHNKQGVFLNGLSLGIEVNR